MINNKFNCSVLPVFAMLMLLASTGCEQPTVGLERSNINDPAHPQYVPGSPKDFNISSDSSGIVYLSWDDEAILEDGYLIEKALGDTSSFEILERLPPDTETFTDSSRTIDLNTYYRVSSFKQQGDLLKRFDPIIEKLTIFELKNSSLTEEPENQRHVLNWEIESDFLQSAEIEISQKFQSQSIILESDLDLNGSYSDNLDRIRFSDRIYVLRGNLGNNETRQIAFETTFTSDINELYSPTSAYVEIVNEMELSVNWTNRAFFADAIELYKRDQSGDFNLLSTLDPETSQYTDYSPVMERNTYQIFSLVGDSKSSFEPASKPFKWQSFPTATVSEASLAIPDYLDLSFSAEPSEVIDELILFRADHRTGERKEIARFPQGTASYRDYTIEPGLKYSYTLESSSTLALSQKAGMNDIEVVLTDRFDKTKVYDLDICRSYSSERTLRLIHDNQYAVVRTVKCDDFGEKLKIINLATDELHEFSIPGINYINDYYYNPSQNTLSAFFSNKMTEITFPDGELVRHIDQLYSGNDLLRFLSIGSAELHSNGRDIYVNTNNGSILNINYETLDVHAIRKGGGSALGQRDIRLSNDDQVLVSHDLVNYVVSAEHNEIIQTFGNSVLEHLPIRTFFSPDDSFYYEVRPTQGLNIYGTGDWGSVNNLLEDITIDADPHPDNSTVIGGFGNSNLVIYNHSQDLYTHVRPFQMKPVDLRFIHSGFRFVDDNTYILSRKDGLLEIWENSDQKSWVLLEE